MKFFLKKNPILLLLVFASALFFLLAISPVRAEGCQREKNSSSFSSFLNPLIPLAETMIKNFGYHISFAAAPDPDFCGSDSAGCSGSMPAATISWTKGPSSYSFYHLVALNSGWTFCVNGGGVCSFSGTKVVRYGADSCGYVYGNFTNSVSCTGSYGNPGPFGASDPCPNIYKHCDYASGLDFKISSINTISHAISSGLANNTLYNWLVEAYSFGGYGYYPSKYYGLTNQPYGSFITPSCIIADIKANGSDGPITISYDTSATLSWTSVGADSCTASNGWSGLKTTSGFESTGSLTSSKTYTITCTGSGGSASDSVIVNIPTVTLTANGVRPQIKIAEGWSVNLDWTSANADSCTASGAWSGSVPAQDQTPAYTFIPSFGIYTYTIQCIGPGGQSSPSSVIVDVVRPVLTLSRGSQTCLAVNLSWSWNDPFFNGEYAQYRVLRSEDGLVFSERTVVSAPTMTYQDNDAFISDQVFYYQIEALKPGSPSVTSNTIETVPCPRLPTWEEVRPR